MGLHKTDKAREELQPGRRSLGQRERCLLLLADGKKTLHEVAAHLGDDAERLVLQLVRDGYLAQDPPAAPPAPARHGAVDLFDGRRSLASARMFLFDICERMFVKRLPAQAEAFRDALREARDRSSMLQVSRAMMAAVEELAGADRADSIRQRIALLLPQEQAEVLAA